jgi:hypothetical protein
MARPVCLSRLHVRLRVRNRRVQRKIQQRTGSAPVFPVPPSGQAGSGRRLNVARYRLIARRIQRLHDVGI